MKTFLHKQSRLILYIKHNFHSLSRIQFFFPSQSLSLSLIKLNVNKKERKGLFLHFAYWIHKFYKIIYIVICFQKFFKTSKIYYQPNFYNPRNKGIIRQDLVCLPRCTRLEFRSKR